MKRKIWGAIAAALALGLNACQTPTTPYSTSAPKTTNNVSQASTPTASDVSASSPTAAVAVSSPTR